MLQVLLGGWEGKNRLGKWYEQQRGNVEAQGHADCINACMVVFCCLMKASSEQQQVHQQLCNLEEAVRDCGN